LNQILKRQTSRSHYGSKVPAVTISTNEYWEKELHLQCRINSTDRLLENTKDE
jgi:hypothetical protein